MPSIRPIYGDRRITLVRDVRSFEQAQETTTSDAGHSDKSKILRELSNVYVPSYE
jgi:hypothetical protein